MGGGPIPSLQKFEKLIGPLEKAPFIIIIIKGKFFSFRSPLPPVIVSLRQKSSPVCPGFPCQEVRPTEGVCTLQRAPRQKKSSLLCCSNLGSSARLLIGPLLPDHAPSSVAPPTFQAHGPKAPSALSPTSPGPQAADVNFAGICSLCPLVLGPTVQTHGSG